MTKITSFYYLLKKLDITNSYAPPSYRLKHLNGKPLTKEDVLNIFFSLFKICNLNARKKIIKPESIVNVTEDDFGYCTAITLFFVESTRSSTQLVFHFNK